MTGHKLGYPIGLTGATAATRYVGATASGAPVSGTFAVGDYVISQAGFIYVCTAAGSPGTWASASAADIATHVAAGDPHPAYALESALAAVATSGSASDLGTGTLPIARVADGAVTYAKLQDVSATARLLGRKTAGVGDVEEISGVDFDTLVGTMDAEDPYTLQKLLEWNYSSIGATGSFTPTSQASYFLKVPVRRTRSVTNIVLRISTGGTMSANNFAGLYSVSGDTLTLVGLSADQNTSWNSGADKVIPLVGGPFVLTGGPGIFCYVGLLATGSSLTGLFRSVGSVSYNAGLVAADGYRFAVGATGLTALPSSRTMSGLVSANSTIWCALS